VAVVVILGVVAVRWRLRQLDPILVRGSWDSLAAFVRYEVGDYTGAARMYRHDLASIATVEGLRTNDPEVALLQGDPTRAESLATAELARDPAAVAPILVLVNVALDTGDLDVARRRVQQAVAADPTGVDAQTLAGVVYARLGSDDEAIVWINRALHEYRPLRRWTTFLQLLAATGDLERRDPPPACVLAHLHRYLRVYDLAQATVTLDWAERAIAQGDHPDAAYVCIGIVRNKQIDDDGALAAFRTAVAQNPRNAEAHNWAAVVYAQRGDLEEELAMRRRAYEISPDDPTTGFELATLLADKLGEQREALDIEARIIGSGHGSSAVLRHAGSLYAELGNSDQALAYFQRAVALAPGDAHYRCWLAWALLRSGHPDEAIAEYRRAVQVDQFSVDAHMGLTRSYREVGRFDDAIRELETVFRLDPAKRWYQIELCHLYLLAGRFEDARRCGDPLLFRDSPTSEATFLATFSLLDPGATAR
jgi:tetratricopeptide (TPR) repeat protein